MAKLCYKMMQKFIIVFRSVNLLSELSNLIILNSLYIVIEFYLVFTFPVVLNPITFKFGVQIVRILGRWGNRYLDF